MAAFVWIVITAFVVGYALGSAWPWLSKLASRPEKPEGIQGGRTFADFAARRFPEGVRIESFEAWRAKGIPGMIDLDALNALFTSAWGEPKRDYARVLHHSFAWIMFWEGSQLLGFLNVAWDGGSHFFLLDTTVRPDVRHQGIAKRMVERAIEMCRGKGEWIHVDTDSVELMMGLYVPCGFRPCPAGALDLRSAPTGSRGI